MAVDSALASDDALVAVLSGYFNTRRFSPERSAIVQAGGTAADSFAASAIDADQCTREG
jgi:hypothetical protein